MDGIGESIGMVQAAMSTSILAKVMGQSAEVIDTLMADMPDMAALDVGASSTLGTNMDLYV